MKEKITWETWQPQPGEFKCLICNHANAEYIIHTQGFHFPVCVECSKLTDGELFKSVEPHK